MFRSLLLAVLLTMSSQAGAAPLTKAQQDEVTAAFDAAAKTAIHGPTTVKLLDQATLTLTENEVFVPTAEANQIMRAFGNQTDPKRFGLVLGNDNSNWVIDIGWIREGHVSDDDAKDWQADAMLQDLKDGTEASNADRTARGMPALDVVGWVEPPTYSAATHRLVWSLGLRDRGTPADQPGTVNYNTYALGRDGYFTLDLITGSDTIAGDKHLVSDLLQTLTYAPGRRYEDFNQSTDSVAAYGIAALVGAVAVKKLGLLALAGVFLLKVWKIGLIAFIAIGAGIKRFFTRSKPTA